MGNKNADNTAKKQQKRIIGKPFQKGQSGNPAGRPQGSISITTEIKKKLNEIPVGQKNTYLELLINRILKQAVVDGNEQMIKVIWNYLDGMPRNNFGEDNSFVPVQIIIKKVDDNNKGN